MQKNQKIVVGIDEAGRGPLAGPVVAAAVFTLWGQGRVRVGSGTSLTPIRDSKKMTTKQREKVFEFVKKELKKKNPKIFFSTARVGERVIDKINILEATRLAMKRAIENLEKQLGKQADLLLIDGNITLALKRNQQAIIKGDAKVPIISLASIIAKVSRDKIMENYHKKYPEYNFKQHKGYPTKKHYQAILVNSPCKIHRQSFRLVKTKG